ncbi:hypothetical protein HOH87_08225 [bacterium]|nr:hypothetical protein [bacterium]
MIAIKLGTTDVVRSFFYLAKEIEYVCFFLLIINWLPGERSDTKVMHRALMTGVGLSIGFMIFQAVMGIKGLTAGAYGPGLIGESSPNPSGTMLSFCTFYLFSLYYQTRDKKYLKWSLWSSLAVLITVSKLNICALLLTFILFTPKKWMVTGRISKQMTKLLIVFIVLFGVGIVSAIFILDLTHIQGRLLSLHSYRHSIYLRVLLIWGPAIELVKQSVQTMFLGFGKGFKPVTFLAGTVSFDNIYLRQIIEGGIIGISLFVIYYSGIVLRLRSWGRKGGVEVKSYSMALLLFIGFLMINGIFADSFMVVRGMEPFYILLAMTYLAVVTEKKERLKKELDEPAVHH